MSNSPNHNSGSVVTAVSAAETSANAGDTPAATEAIPGSVSTRKAALLRELGVARISLGVQSWDNALLKLLGREHSAQQAEQSFRLLRAAGFSNINIDLMFGLPGQTIEQWRLTLQKTIALQPDH